MHHKNSKLRGTNFFAAFAMLFVFGITQTTSVKQARAGVVAFPVWHCEGASRGGSQYVIEVEDLRGAVSAEVWEYEFGRFHKLAQMPCRTSNHGNPYASLDCEYVGNRWTQVRVIIGPDKVYKTTIGRIGRRGEVISVLNCSDETPDFD